MKTANGYILLLILLFFGTISAQSSLNLDFEEIEKGMPKRWHGNGDGYKFVADTTTGFMSKRSLLIYNAEKRVQAGTTVAFFPVEAARGKKIVFSGFIKTEKVDQEWGWAGLWLRVDGKDAEGKPKILGFDNMKGRGAKYSEDWKRLVIEMKVDENATGIFFGALLVGTGKAWFDYLEFEIDGKLYDDVIPGMKK